MKRTTTALLGFLGAFLIPATASANGFFLYEVSPRAVAQGGATVAEGGEPATVMFNPAAMTRLEGFQLQANLYTYIATNKWTDPNTGETTNADPAVFPIPAFFATYKATDWMALGVGSFSQWGLAITWPDNWKGSTITQKSSLRSYQIQPSIAFGPFKGLSAGAGMNFIFGSVELKRRLALGDESGTTTIGGNANAMTPNFSLFYEATDWLRLGSSYRHKATVKLDPGDADFEVPAAYDQQLRDQKVRASITLPSILQFGVRVLPMKDFEVEADAFYLFWHMYDKLVFEFDDPTLNQTQVYDYHDAWEWRLGAQYHMSDLSLRAGIMWDATPIPDETLDPLLPDNHRIIPSLGAGYDFGIIRADAAYQFVYLLPRTVNEPVNKFPAKYNGVVHTISLGATLEL